MDSLNPPVIFSEIFNELASSELPKIIKTLVSALYSSSGTKVLHEGQPLPYKDTNITISVEEQLVDIWSLIEDQVDKSRLNTALDLTYEKSKNLAIKAFYDGSDSRTQIPHKSTLLTLKYVLLIGGLS